MHIITRKRLNEFAAKHPNAKPGLAHWYRLLKPATVHSFVELRTLFPSADQVGKLTVFNIGGNTARLIAAIHYNRQKIYIRAVLTHEETTKGNGRRTDTMTTSEMQTVEQVWPSLAPFLFVPHTEREYERLVQILDTLIDLVGEDETHPFASLMEIIGVLIEKYEDEHVPEISAA